MWQVIDRVEQHWSVLLEQDYIKKKTQVCSVCDGHHEQQKERMLNSRNHKVLFEILHVLQTSVNITRFFPFVNHIQYYSDWSCVPVG